ncbi:MAG: hypothetical protein ABI442_11405, partial [Gemmatimonadaceae bacterium]
MRHHNVRSAICAAIAVVLIGTGCASATKRYEQGKELEGQGRPADAAQRYISTLKKDPSYTEARDRLVESGRIAIAEYARQADALATTGAYTDAADVLWAADELLHDASVVGVTLQTSPGYAERHGTVLSGAVDEATFQRNVGIIARRLNGTAGLTGWQWLYLVEGIPSIILGVAVFFSFTDRPEDASWLTSAERTWLTERLTSERAARASVSEKSAVKALISPTVWWFAILYFFTISAYLGVIFFGPAIVAE